MASSKRSWVLEPCPEEPPKRQRFPGHSKEAIKSPTKKHAPSRRGKRYAPTQLNKPPPGLPQRDTIHPQRIAEQESAEHALPWEDMSPLVAEVDMAGGTGNEPEKADDGDVYSDFVHLVDEEYITFVQVTTFLYVVQGFDAENRSGTGLFYHLEARKSGETAVRLSCLCPDGKKGDCIHKRFYRNFRDLRFRINEEAVKVGEILDMIFVCEEFLMVAEEGEVVLFRRQMIGTDDET
ncbi:hypothetical protein VNI00_017852 [Paramarasmius palmivorus]|uniref:SWIM-type domain-containing protein n=1 Tax=Paramarasmius palmivorus TaxID=297713 RepID=A0AAW0B2M6_9AGAR